MMASAVAAGLVAGVAYTLAPLTVLCLAAFWGLWLWARRGLSAPERQWLGALLTAAVAARLIAVAALFLLADPAEPYGYFFGDEEFFKRRTIWLRNLGLGVPIPPSDIIYTFDEVGQTSYVYLLAFLQALVGESPYSVHVFNTVLYVAAMLGLYRLVRPSFGGVAAMGGLALLLFMPSLFIWSVSALKESSYMLVATMTLACAVYVARAPRAWQRVVAGLGIAAGALLLESLRAGGLLVALVGAVGGLALGLTIVRPRLLLASLVVAPVLVVVALQQAPVQERLLAAVRQGALYHSGHIATPGFTYTLIRPEYYADRPSILRMPADESARFVIRALVSYVTVPLPWHIESRAMLVYLPEHMVWYLLLPFALVGLVAGWRRDGLLTSVIAAHAVAAILIVALTSGNVGTLARHRGLALPYLVWLSALGVCEIMRRATLTPAGSPAWSPPDGPR
jgi:hypothetical protein